LTNCAQVGNGLHVPIRQAEKIAVLREKVFAET
jgi:hypothetical protein